MNSIVTSLFSILNVGRLQVSLEELTCTFLVNKNSCQLMLINELVAGSKVMAACSHVNFFQSNNISLQPFADQTTVLAVFLAFRHGPKCGVLGESLASCHNLESVSSCPPVFS